MCSKLYHTDHFHITHWKICYFVYIAGQNYDYYSLNLVKIQMSQCLGRAYVNSGAFGDSREACQRRGVTNCTLAGNGGHQGQYGSCGLESFYNVSAKY